MKTKKIPLRTCIVTKEKLPKQELIRVVRTPEKEIIMIVIEREKAESVKRAIGDMEILKKKGMGIMFSIPVRDFVNLG